ncbi:signal transduction histidine kinase [Thioclava atlantica]|uniref:histidine kinase n=1 Tax=Thioclava atlantica TaxID=1317124 RepID=A0A085TXG7_9RHOB|nr:signal transduction histidine kinase [Thioclava atlantica]
MAHDFNNLLTAISGHCDLLMLRHDKNDPDYADLDQISQNANRAAALVGQLLAYSRKQTLKPQSLDLRETLADLTHLLNRLVGERTALTVSHASDLAPIRADKRQLEQVIMNLVVNARDAMPEGGQIRVETEMANLDADQRFDRATVPRGRYVVIRVSDEGVGIAPEKIGKIFEPFFTTKRTGEGTGLGLSTAYGIVKQTGGYIFCESAVGAGTTFTIYLPAHERLADARDAAEEETTVPDPMLPSVNQSWESARPPHAAAEGLALMPAKGALTRWGDATVLLVEDEAPVRAFASRALKLRGFTVLEADSAEEALSLLEDPDLVVDIFVTDVIMPGLDGPSWVRKALETRPGTRTVFVSGYAEDVFRDGTTPVRNSVFLPKPFSLSELTTTVQNQLAEPDQDVQPAPVANAN